MESATDGGRKEDNLQVKKLALSVALMIASLVTAGADTYKVQPGDTVSEIADKFGVSQTKLMQINSISSPENLQIGRILTIPSSTTRYTVQKGDNDWSVSKKFGMSVSELHKLNPGINWTALQIGSKLVVKGSSGSSSSSSSASTKTTKYTVVKGDNDHKIARKFGTSSAVIRQLNPGLDWTCIQIGQKLNVPTSGVVASKSSSKSTRSSSSSAPSKAISGCEATASSIIACAKEMLGTPYRWGASRSSAVDCSGLTSYVFKLHGIKLPRRSTEQATVGKSISKGELKKGDLVFFRTGRGTRINHVGIYIGNNKFIHASSGGGKVQINSLDAGYYRRKYAGARRVADFQVEQDDIYESIETAKEHIESDPVSDEFELGDDIATYPPDESNDWISE